MQHKLFILLAICGFSELLAYSIPNVKFEVLPDGFRASIPDEPGVVYVAFNINRNKPFESFEQGEFSAQIRKPINNRWVYENKRHLEDDDVIYIWMHVQHNQLGYRSVVQASSVSAAKGTNDNQQTLKPDSRPSAGGSIGTTEREKNNDVESCQRSITVVPNRNVCQGQLIFEDNFGSELNTSLWRHEVRLPLDRDDAEFVLYDTLATVNNGVLSIVPKLWNDDRPGTRITRGDLDLGARCTGIQNLALECKRQPEGQNVLPPVVSGRINTKNAFSFKYGRIELRAQLPQGDWLFPLMLLEPVSSHYGLNGYASGQMRIAFIRGNQKLVTASGLDVGGRTLYGGAVLSREAELRCKSLRNATRTEHFGEGFHVYSLTWSNLKLVLEVDGEEYGHVDGDFSNIYSNDLDHVNSWKTGEYMAPFDQFFYITLGVSVGGNGDFPDESTSTYHRKPWTNTSPKAPLHFWRARTNWKSSWTSPGLKVDYVRVYAI